MLEKVISGDSEGEIRYLAMCIVNAFKLSGKSEFIVVNVGSDIITGDSIAPLAGTAIRGRVDYAVYGCVRDSINALNILSKLEDIKFLHTDAFILGVDAILGLESSVGMVCLRDKPVSAREGLDEPICSVGDMSLVGCVHTKCTATELRLESSHKVAFKLASTIADVLLDVNLLLKASSPNIFNCIP